MLITTDSIILNNIVNIRTFVNLLFRTGLSKPSVAGLDFLRIKVTRIGLFLFINLNRIDNNSSDILVYRLRENNFRL